MGVTSTVPKWQKHSTADPGVHSLSCPLRNRGACQQGLQFFWMIIITRHPTTCHNFTCALAQYAKTLRQFSGVHGLSEVTELGSKADWLEMGPSIVAQQRS